jgi:hypothetical protein
VWPAGCEPILAHVLSVVCQYTDTQSILLKLGCHTLTPDSKAIPQCFLLGLLSQIPPLHPEFVHAFLPSSQLNPFSHYS